MPVIIDPDHCLVANTEHAWNAGRAALAAIPRIWSSILTQGPHAEALEVRVSVDEHAHVPTIHLELNAPSQISTSSCAIRILPFSAELSLLESLQAHLTALVQHHQMGQVLFNALSQGHAALWGGPAGLEPKLLYAGLDLQIYTEPPTVAGHRILHRWTVRTSGSQCEWSYSAHCPLTRDIASSLSPARLPLSNPVQALADSLSDFMYQNHLYQMQC